MLQELIYTSAPTGLKPGSQGFCTVACTTGMPPNLAKLLETLSGYRHVFLPPDPNANNNPASCSHLLLNLGGVPWHILSRTADAGLDYTKRTNKISHHIVLDKAELQECGPAAVLTQYPFQVSWNQKPVVLPANKKLPTIQSQTRVCEQWRQLTGDAGWGGILAETALTKRQVSIIFRPGMNMLPLIDEALALLKPELRWQVSFSTYCCNLPNGTGCQWKCILAGSPEVAQARLTADTLVIDLTQTSGAPPAGQLVEAARSGKLPESQAGAIPIVPGQGAYDIKDISAPPTTPPVAVPSASKEKNTDSKSQSGGKGKKKGNNDPTSKGCFWAIILFFILVTAGLIGGIAWLSGAITLNKNSSVKLEKTIESQQTQIEQLQQQLNTEREKQKQDADDHAEWQKEKQLQAGILNAKNAYIEQVADYFSLFPPMRLSPEPVNLKDGIPRKTGETAPLKEIVTFNGTIDAKWNFENMFAVTNAASDAGLECFVGEFGAYPGSNVLLGYPCRLLAKTGSDAREPIMEFELVVTAKGIAVRHFNDERWNSYVAEQLKKKYTEDSSEDGFGMQSNFIDWYENNIKDKNFVLDENMLDKFDELDAGTFSGSYADVQRLIDLRKRYFAGELSLKFDFKLDMKPLSDKVKGDNRNQ